MIVELTADEVREAVAGGKERMSLVKKYNLYGGHRDDARQLRDHIAGAVAEKAVCKKFNVPWTPAVQKNFKSLTDVGENIEVKTTTLADGNLLINKKDKDNQIAILVRLVWGKPRADLVGWAHIRDTKKPEYWRDSYGSFVYRPCYVYPASLLKPMEDLQISS